MIRFGIAVLSLGVLALGLYAGQPNQQKYNYRGPMPKWNQGYPGSHSPTTHWLYGPMPQHNGNGNKNGNANGNTNGNNNRNGNTNKNGNSNTNTNDVTVKVNVGGNGKNHNGNNNNNNNNNGNGLSGLTGGFGNIPQGGSFQGGTYSPQGGSYNPTYTMSPGGYGANSGVAGFAGAVGNNPVGFGPPEPAGNFDDNDPNTAWLTLDLPHEQSEVWLNGVKMPHKGLVRKYVTPPLKQGLVYNYEVKVIWPDKIGAKKNYTVNLQFKAGDEILHKVPEGGPAANAVPAPQVQQPPADEEKNMAQRLAWAKDLLKEGKKDKAKERLKEIVDKSPDSPAGKEAKELLGKI